MRVNKFAAFGAGLLIWALYFYSVDQLLMGLQGLPVGWDMMPK